MQHDMLNILVIHKETIALFTFLFILEWCNSADLPKKKKKKETMASEKFLKIKYPYKYITLQIPHNCCSQVLGS